MRHWNARCVSQCDDWLPVRMHVWYPSVCVYVTKQVGWICSVISWVKCQRANQKADDDSKAAIGSHSLLSSWQQPLWPTTISTVSSMGCYLFFVAHNNISYVWCHHFKRLLTQHSCLQWTLQPASTRFRLNIANFFRDFTRIIFKFSFPSFQYKQQPNRPEFASYVK